VRLLVYSHNFRREGAPIILFRLLRDAAAFAANIARIRHDPAFSRRLSESGRRVLRQNFAFEDHVNRMENELTALAAQ
jgi:glycosyltransferase involved in cell wall biosynthesis